MVNTKRPAHRPPLPPDQRRIKADVTLSKAHHDMTKGPRGTRTKMVARALDALPLADELINAIGHPDFDVDSVLDDLQLIYSMIVGNGNTAASLLALINTLPSLADKANKLYHL